MFVCHHTFEGRKAHTHTHAHTHAHTHTHTHSFSKIFTKQTLHFQGKFIFEKQQPLRLLFSGPATFKNPLKQQLLNMGWIQVFTDYFSVHTFERATPERRNRVFTRAFLMKPPTQVHSTIRSRKTANANNTHENRHKSIKPVNTQKQTHAHSHGKRLIEQ